MEKGKIMSELQDVFRDIFDENDLIINDETNAEDIEDWDSLAQVRITMAIEKKFGIKFKFEELAALRNVGEMLKTIENKMKN